MNLVVSREVFERFPSLRLGIIVANGIDNRTEHPEVTSLLRQEEMRVRSNFTSENIAANPLISNWRAAYKTLRIDKGRPSHEALIRRVARGDSVRHINTLVDIYNYLSLRYITPFGGEDLDKIKGDVKLRTAEGDEKFVELGTEDVSYPDKGEVIYADDEKILCRKFNWRESDLTKLTEDTINAVLVTETLPPFGRQALDDALNEFNSLLTKFCKASSKEFVLDMNYWKLAL